MESMRTVSTRGLVSVLWVGFAAACQMPSETLPERQKDPMVGEIAPGFHSGGALQTLEGEDLKFSTLRGKTVVLEFWATWCIPCIRVIPHLNDLAAKLSGKPIAFVSVSTDEDKPRLSEFLKKTPTPGISAWDPDRKWFNAYQGIGIPHTVIVDAAGRIAGVTSPWNLSVEVLEKIMAGIPVNLPQKEASEVSLDWDRNWVDGIEPLTQVIIKSVSATGSASMYPPGSNRFVADGLFLETLIRLAYEAPPPYVDYRLPHQERQYRVSAIVPKGQETRLLPLLREALKSSFGLSIYWETQEKEVLVLKQLPGKKSGLTPSRAEKSASWPVRGTLHGTMQTMENLCLAVAEWIELPVVDETGLSGKYDWELPYQPGDPSVLIGALNKELGLEAKRSPRQIQVLVVENSGQ